VKKLKGWHLESVVSSFCLEEDIENVTNLCFFYNPLALQSLWNGNFLDLADNGVLGCVVVVVVNSRKWGHIYGPSVGGPVRFWLAGGTGPRYSDKSAPCRAHKQTGPVPSQSVQAPNRCKSAMSTIQLIAG